MRTYTAEDWPHGLRCMGCDRRFIEDMPITSRLVAMREDVPVTELVCADCELGESS